MSTPSPNQIVNLRKRTFQALTSNVKVAPSSSNPSPTVAFSVFKMCQCGKPARIMYNVSGDGFHRHYYSCNCLPRECLEFTFLDDPSERTQKDMIRQKNLQATKLTKIILSLREQIFFLDEKLKLAEAGEGKKEMKTLNLFPVASDIKDVVDVDVEKAVMTKLSF